MAAETRKYISHKAVILCFTAESLLETGEDGVMVLHQHLQLGRDHHTEVPGGYHVLKGRQEHGEDRVQVLNVFALGGYQFINDHITPT